MNKRVIPAAALALLLAAGQPVHAVQPSAVQTVVNGVTLAEGSAILTQNTTYVALRAFCEQAKGMQVDWVNGVAVARKDGLTIRAVPGQPYIEANGRYFFTGTQTPVLLKNGKTMVPIRTLSRVFEGAVTWDGSSRTASVSLGATAVSGEAFYQAEDLYWLARIISAESQGEPLAGQIAVGNVILNRVNSSRFPNTIYDVIFDQNYGVQFTPVAIGSIYWEPTEQSVIAAKLCLDGASVVGKSLYFQNGKLAQSTWIVENCQYITTIGNHQFYI